MSKTNIMKSKIIYLLVLTLLLSSCDEVLDYNYYVQNNYNRGIVIKYKNEKGESKTYEIVSKSNKLIYQKSELVKYKSSFDPNCVKNTFKELNVYTLNGDTSKFDYTDDKFWVKNKISDDLLKCTLTIDSLSFK